MSDPPRVPNEARAAILAWYADRGRPLAFRRTTNPYAILVSEVMAQQTQAARAATYWERFMERFPTVETLAAATPADVIRQWAGLGYDRRALALWRAASAIVSDHGGTVPSTVHELQDLPGVGPYTARAVAALAYGVPVGAVDVNVRRVLGRIVFAAADAPSAAGMQELADAAVPHDHPGAWTHAVMDVGATLCKPRRPRCDDCPARPWCRYPGDAGSADALAVARGAAHGGGRAGRVVREAALPFTSTDRWLRGRILDRLRAAGDGAWVTLEAEIGEHDGTRVRAAADALAIDGIIELQPSLDGAVRARLALS